MSYNIQWDQHITDANKKRNLRETLCSIDSWKTMESKPWNHATQSTSTHMHQLWMLSLPLVSSLQFQLSLFYVGPCNRQTPSQATENYSKRLGTQHPLLRREARSSLEFVLSRIRKEIKSRKQSQIAGQSTMLTRTPRLWNRKWWKKTRY